MKIKGLLGRVDYSLTMSGMCGLTRVVARSVPGLHNQISSRRAALNFCRFVPWAIAARLDGQPKCDTPLHIGYRRCKVKG